MKKLYFDCETTGLDPIKNDIIQIAGVIEIDGHNMVDFNFKSKPFNWDAIETKALEIS